MKAIAAYLNRNGIPYRNGRRFSTGLVYRLLTREACTGRSWFNQIDVKTQTRKPREEWIEIRLPLIIDEDTFARTQASLARRSPKKIAPRIVNSPVLLTGLAQCATCGGGMQLRTGKRGKYRYYTCSTCIRQGKTACKGRSVRMDFLDKLVLEHLARRVFVPERIGDLLAEHLTRSRDGAAESMRRAKEAGKELREIDTRITRLYEMVERGISPLDETLSARLAELRGRREEALRLKRAMERQRDLPSPPVAPGGILAFCEAMQAQLLRTDIATRKTYLRLFVERIEIDDAEVRMFGPKGALEAGLRHGPTNGTSAVPTFVQDWRPRGDSNPCYCRERAMS